MSAPVSNPSIHRLIDIVVEEVSLVDRAANQRRFLIVKRSVPMSSTQESNDQNKVTDPAADDQERAGGSSGDTSIPAGLVDSTVEALERLTDVVEELRDSPDSAMQSRLGEVTRELRAIAQTLLEVSGSNPASESEETPDGRRPDELADVLGAVRAALEQLKGATALWKAKAQPAGAPPDPAAAAKEADMAKGQEAALQAQKETADALAKLTEAVKNQGQRLSHLEKRFGLPNSTPSSERSQKKTEDEVGWPMDLNRPFDRDSVDESVSFHDL